MDSAKRVDNIYRQPHCCGVKATYLFIDVFSKTISLYLNIILPNTRRNELKPPGLKPH